jgi:hypothetical protein
MARTPIEEVSHDGERPAQKWEGHADVDEETAHTVVQCAYDPLRFPVLSGDIGARKAEANPVGGKVLTNNSIIKLLAVVGLERNQRQLKLRQNISMEGDQALNNVRLCTKGKVQTKWVQASIRTK